MKKIKWILPIVGSSMLAATAGALAACNSGQDTKIVKWPGNFSPASLWNVISDEKVQIKSGGKYSVNFNWTDVGTQLDDVTGDGITVFLFDETTNESFDFDGSTYELEAFNTNTNVWDKIPGLIPVFEQGVNKLFADSRVIGKAPWLPKYYKQDCRFTFTAQKSSVKPLQFIIGIKNE